MKKTILIALLFLSINVIAQHKNWDHIKALKVSFITEELELSEKEAQKFWPLYNDYEKKTSDIRYHELRAIRKEIKENSNTLTDDQAKILIDKISNAENRLHELKTNFTTKISTVISPKKIILLKVVEEDFKRKMFDELKKRKKGKN
jgi:Skp family chaperone for outer membrane proteins